MENLIDMIHLELERINVTGKEKWRKTVGSFRHYDDFPSLTIIGQELFKDSYYSNNYYKYSVLFDVKYDLTEEQIDRLHRKMPAAILNILEEKDGHISKDY